MEVCDLKCMTVNVQKTQVLPLGVRMLWAVLWPFAGQAMKVVSTFKC